MDHGGQHRSSSPRLHGKHNAVDHHDNDHDHHPSTVVKAELEGFRDRKSPVVAGYPIEFTDSEDKNNHAQSLPPIGPNRGEPRAKSGRGTAHSAGACHHFSKHKKTN